MHGDADIRFDSQSVVADFLHDGGVLPGVPYPGIQF
jgi:hypothetical protein